MIAAVTAARNGAAVTLIEQNDRVGKKICATGNGKCNLTNETMGEAYYHCREKAFVASVLQQFSEQDTLDFFRSAGLCFVSRNGYVYPRSEQAQSVVNILQEELRRNKVKIKTKEKIVRIEPPLKEADSWKIFTEGWCYDADALILANGSCASAIAGADGSGYELATQLGHRVIRPLPALVPLKCRGIRFSSWSGVRVAGCVQLLIDGCLTEEAKGELQLTEYGISGIPVFQISAQASRALAEGKKTQIALDFMPEMSRTELEAFLLDRRKQFPEWTSAQLLEGIFPDKLIKVLTGQKNLEETIKNLTLSVTGTGSFEKAQVCCGGVDVAQVRESMESKVHRNLFFCGELLDVDGICGGYNLQWAWSTGAIAGKAAAKSVKERGDI